MSRLIKWKKPLYLAFALGIIGFSTYGIYHTVQACNDVKQSQTTDYTLTSDSSRTGDSMVSGGSSCNPLGCAACRGCVSQQYQQSIETLPSFAVQVEQID